MLWGPNCLQSKLSYGCKKSLHTEFREGCIAPVFNLIHSVAIDPSLNTQALKPQAPLDLPKP